MDILITNDDGILAEGLTVLRRVLEPLGTVWVVAPEREQSGASHALTLHRPLRVRRHAERVFSVDGTPTDCVLLASRGMPALQEIEIDLVVSGINHGLNLGADVTYSGTVAAAIEGLLLSRPAVAISTDGSRPEVLAAAGEVARTVVERTTELGLPPGVFLNVNVPKGEPEGWKGFRITTLNRSSYSGQVFEKTDPRGRPYYWIGEEKPIEQPQSGSDAEAVRDGYVSITPLHLDLTDHGAIPLLRRWDLSNGRPRSQ